VAALPDTDSCATTSAYNTAGGHVPVVSVHYDRLN